MQRKTRLLIILLPVAILVAGVSIFLSHRQHTATTTKQASGSHTVTLDNAATYLSGITGVDIQSIQSALYHKVSTTVSTPAGGYHATVRSGTVNKTSYTYAVDGTSMPYYRFLVDIPAVKQSFEVTLAGGINYSVDIVHVLCPQSDQLIYPKFECTDPEQ